MTITVDNASAVVAWKFPGQQGITLNLEPSVAWADRFVEWPEADIGPPPDQATADLWADEWRARFTSWPTTDLDGLAKEIGQYAATRSIARLCINKGLFTAVELRDMMADEAVSQ